MEILNRKEIRSICAKIYWRQSTLFVIYAVSCNV